MYKYSLDNLKIPPAKEEEIKSDEMKNIKAEVKLKRMNNTANSA